MEKEQEDRRSLESISDFEMSYCELSEDLLFAYIPEKNRADYIERSIELARKESTLYRKNKIADLYGNNDIEVRFHEESSSGFLHAQMYCDQKIRRADIYLNVLQDIQAAMRDVGYGFSMQELTDLHLAHEFYHFLEFQNDRRTYELLEPLEYRSFGFWKRKAAIRRTSEISAHIFAKNICNFCVHPKILDYILMEYQSADHSILKHKLDLLQPAMKEESACVWN